MSAIGTGLRKGWKFIKDAVDPQVGRGEEFMRQAATERARAGNPQALMQPNPATKMGGFKNWAANHTQGSVQAAKDYGRSMLDDAATLAKGGGRLAAAGRLAGKVAAPVGVIASAADIIDEQNSKTAAEFANESGNITGYDPAAEQSLWNDVVLGGTERGLGALRTFGKQFIPNSWATASSTPLPDLPLDPATAAKGKAIAAKGKAPQQADAMAYGVAADPDGSYANAEAARFSNQPAPPPNHEQLQKQAMDPNATEADRIKAVGQQYGVDPKNITFRQMGPDSVFKVGKNIYTDGSDPTNRVSNMNEPWTPEKAATLERVGQMERYNNYLRAGYDPATARRLMEGGRVQDSTQSLRDMANSLMAKASGMKYGGYLRDDAIALLGLAQKQDAEEAAAQKNRNEPVSFRDMLAMQQFGLDKQKFGYQQKKDEAEFNRSVTKDKAALSSEQKAAAAKSHEDRMKALFTDPKSGQIDQAAVADFNRRAAGFAADLGKNIDQLTSEEFGRLQSLKAMHDLAKDRAGLLFHKGSYKDNADYRAYEPIMKNGKVEVEQGIGGTFIKLRNGSLVNYEDLKKKGGLPFLRWFGQSTSPSNYGVDPTTLPQ